MSDLLHEQHKHSESHSSSHSSSINSGDMEEHMHDDMTTVDSGDMEEHMHDDMTTVDSGDIEHEYMHDDMSLMDSGDMGEHMHDDMTSMDSGDIEHEYMHDDMSLMDSGDMGEHMHDGADEATSILSVPDLNGDGSIDNADMRDIISRYEAVEGEDLYHPLYDLNANGEIDNYDLETVIHELGSDVPLIDQQVAQATQATMKYYGSGGQEQAIADGYIPSTQELQGHGIHYYNPTLEAELGNSEELDIERPLGLNFNNEGSLQAIYYVRFPNILEATSEDTSTGIEIDPADDFPPSSFDTLTDDDWHTHESMWFSGAGNLNSELVYFDEDTPSEAAISRLEQIDFQVFPASDQSLRPKIYMMHGWFHSFNPNGRFAITNPNLGLYAPQELGVHGGHEGHGSGDSDPLISGTDLGEELIGTDGNDRINGFGGDDWIQAGLGDDSVWGSYGNDWIKGDDDYTFEAGDDMLYGGPGHDLIYGHGGSDRLFGGTDNDQLVGGEGDDLLRGSLGYDILTGDAGSDSFVLAMGEGTDIITDFEIESDTLVFYTGITSETVSMTQLDNNTALSFGDETLAILNGVNAEDLMAASDSAFMDV